MTDIVESRVDDETAEFAQQIADSVESFLLALRAIARTATGGQAVSLLLLEISQVLLAGARMGAQRDFTPSTEYQPDVGPEADLDGLRHYRSGDIEEALWWWQFSYVASWGNLAGAALNALLSVVSHDRLDVDYESEIDQIEAAEEILDVAPE